jgi:hypothetical protein
MLSTGHRGKQCELIAVFQDLIEVGVFLIDSNYGTFGDVGIGLPQKGDSVEGSTPGWKLERYLASAGLGSVLSEEEKTNLHEWKLTDSGGR